MIECRVVLLLVYSLPGKLSQPGSFSKMAMAMSVTIVEDGRPTYWVASPVATGNGFELTAWPPTSDRTFPTGSAFIGKMTNWLRNNFPDAKFSIRSV